MKRATSLCVLLALRAASPEGLRGARAEGGARRWLSEWAVARWSSALDAIARRRLLPWYMYEECLDLVANDDAVLATINAAFLQFAGAPTLPPPD